MAAISVEKMKMTETSIDTLESSYDNNTASQTDTTQSDDDDDELLALRIAALESIKLQKSKSAATASKASNEINEEEKPDFVIKSHSTRSNLLSIVTCEEEKDKPADRASPPLIPYFDPTRPPPGFTRGSAGRLSPYGRRSPGFRRSRSPGRRPWSRSPPPHFRRRSMSPFSRRRRSFSRSPGRRRSPVRGRSRSRSPVKERSPSVSEWETDTETEDEPENEDEEAQTKAESKTKAANKVSVDESKPAEEKIAEKKDASNDDDGDDILKLDASAEEDEFSAFLNEFEDEVLEKKEKTKTGAKKEKKERPDYEKKVVDGKKMRKKIKPKKETPPPSDRRSSSPRGARSPGAKYFSPSRSKFSSDRASQDRQRNGKSRDRSTKSRERMMKESKPSESAAEREERERKEYEDRLAKLPTPEREMMEARRKKFEKKVEGSKKISLKSVKTEEEPVNFDIKKRGSRDSEDRENKAKVDDDKSPGSRRNVTDLRVQLHKKKKASETTTTSVVTDARSRLTLKTKTHHPLARSVSPEDLDQDLGSVEKTGRRKVVAPGKRVVRRNISEEESDRSPSPPQQLLTRKRKSSGDTEDNMKGRRILVLRKDGRSSPEDDFTITKKVSPSKGLKKSLTMRLGAKVGELAESDIYMDILREQEIKKKEAKRLKKEKKRDKKEKKKAKKKKSRDSDNDSDRAPAAGDDSDEELFRFFEDDPDSKKSKRRSGEKVRLSSGGDQPVKKRFVRAKFEDEEMDELQMDKQRINELKRRVSNEGDLDEESADLLEKMRRKNEKRLKRMREIEKDKLMFS